MQLSFNMLPLNYQIKNVPISTGSAFKDFRCKDIPSDTPSNVTELQFCDGVSNCMDGSDEPQHCPAGMVLPLVSQLCDDAQSLLSQTA